VAVSGSNVVVVWHQYDESDYFYNIYSDYSTDGGATWHTDQLVEVNDGNAFSAQVTIDGSNVVAVWRQVEPGNTGIYAAYSTNAGANWNSAGAIDSRSPSADSPKVAMDGSNVVAVWYQYDGEPTSRYHIYSNYSTNGGQTWGASDQRIEDNDSYDGYIPEVAISGSNVVAVWSQYDASTHRQIYSNYSTNGGQTWGSDQRIEDNLIYQAEYQKVAMNGLNVIAVWRQEDGVQYGIYSNYSTDGGQTWASDQLIENNSGQASDPDVAMSATTAVAVWYQNDGTTYRVYSSYSTDGGANWSPDKIIDTNPGDFANNPKVAIYGDVPVAAWYQWDGSNTRVYSSYAEFVDVPAGGGGCFIATAAFGSPYERHVKTLRQFRDSRLLTNRPGRAFVRWYYRHSPSYADYIRRRPAARMFVRTLLRPLAWLVSLR